MQHIAIHRLRTDPRSMCRPFAKEEENENRNGERENGVQDPPLA